MTTVTAQTCPQRVFDADVDRFHEALSHYPGAVVTDENGTRWVDPSRIPAGLADAYAGAR